MAKTKAESKPRSRRSGSLCKQPKYGFLEILEAIDRINKMGNFKRSAKNRLMNADDLHRKIHGWSFLEESSYSLDEMERWKAFEERSKDFESKVHALPQYLPIGKIAEFLGINIFQAVSALKGSEIAEADSSQPNGIKPKAKYIHNVQYEMTEDGLQALWSKETLVFLHIYLLSCKPGERIPDLH